MLITGSRAGLEASSEERQAASLFRQRLVCQLVSDLLRQAGTEFSNINVLQAHWTAVM